MLKTTARGGAARHGGVTAPADDPTMPSESKISKHGVNWWRRIFWSSTRRRILVVALLALAVAWMSSKLHLLPIGVVGGSSSRRAAVPPWQEGMLDLHHLHVGSSVSTFCIFPDGTTMLIDAGDVNVQAMEAVWSKMGPPWNALRLRRSYPSTKQTPVGWIVNYLEHFWPHTNNNIRNNNKTLDYVLLTHFHSDHMGDGAPSPDRKSTTSSSPTYILSGIPELAQRMGIRKLIDRGYPSYNEPQDLKAFHDATINNYLHFVQANQHKISMEQFQVGSTKQIQLQHNLKDKNDQPHPFQVRVLKANLQVMAVPDSSSSDTTATTMIGGAQPWDEENGHGNENVLSAALVMQYGNFRYYEGADQEVIRNSKGDIVLDTIGPTARAAGRVDVATLNHHGHGVSKDYINVLDPRVMILQGWSSDQPPTGSIQLFSEHQQESQEPQQRQIFATDIFEERLQDMGQDLAKMFASTSGHILVRAHKPPAAAEQPQTYEIFVLDGQRKVKSHHGPYNVPAK